MTFFQRLRAFFFLESSPNTSFDVTTNLPPIPAPLSPSFSAIPPTETGSSTPPIPYSVEPLPNWLADEDSLRDEGVLFGLSDARPDGKVAQIRAFFSRQTAPLTELVDENTEKIGELNLLIEQIETKITTLHNQIDELRNSQPRPSHLIRTTVSLLLSVAMCTCNFYLIDQTLRPAFPNRLVGLGIFMAGMFNLFSRTSFFYEEGSRLSVRRVVAEAGLPLAASVFILAQALQSQTVGMSIALFVFTFFLFLLAGTLFLSNISALQTDLNNRAFTRQLTIDKVQKLPIWEAEIERLNREVDAIRTQKWPIATTLNRVQADITRLNTKRDELVNLFVSEFELARSLRDRLSEQQRKLVMNADQ